jgi:hypothetical protein
LFYFSVTRAPKSFVQNVLGLAITSVDSFTAVCHHVLMAFKLFSLSFEDKGGGEEGTPPTIRLKNNELLTRKKEDITQMMP